MRSKQVEGRSAKNKAEIPDHASFGGLIIEISGRDVVGNLEEVKHLARWLQFRNIAISIDDLGADLSPYAGLLTQDGFQVVAAKHNLRADISWNLTYNQVLYLANSLGIPVIVNFRRDYGYYHYFAGGHFLVVTGGDQQGVSIVDSSEYFIKYLPHDVFDGLWQWRGDGSAMTVVIVPADFHYTLPNV